MCASTCAALIHACLRAPMPCCCALLQEDEYYEQLDAVASLVSEWGLADQYARA